jgi:hypothetical protein
MNNPFRPGSQKYRILERLREGPANSSELAKYALNYTARISEIRREIQNQGLSVSERPINRSLSEYRISNQAELGL